MKKNNIGLLIGIIVVIIIIIIIFLSKGKKVDSSYDFSIYFFKAGKADAIIVSKNDKHILIDTGEETCGDLIVEYLKNHKIKKLDALIITHFDKDHVGGAAKVIEKVKIDKVLQSNEIKNSEYFSNYHSAITKKSLVPVTVLGNYDLSFDDLEIIVNGPAKRYEKNTSNNSSLIVSIKNNKNKFLFMGDAMNARIKDYLNEHKDTYDFIKIPYHGKNIKQLDNLLDVVKAKYGVMTCSVNEGCDKKTIKKLNHYKVKYYMTKYSDITVYSNGKEIIIK